MIEYHVFWVLYAVATLLGWHEYNSHDCRVISLNTHVETKYEGATCYRRNGDAWEIVR